MRLRGGFIVMLVVVLLAAISGYGVMALRQRSDRQDLNAADSLAHHLRAPQGAVTSQACRGDGLVSCWTSTQGATVVAQALAAEMRVAGAYPTLRCSQMKVGPAGGTVVSQECSAIVRFGSRAVAAFVSPTARHGNGGNVTIDGSLISLSAA